MATASGPGRTLAAALTLPGRCPGDGHPHRGASLERGSVTSGCCVGVRGISPRHL